MDFLSALADDEDEHTQAAGWIAALACAKSLSEILPALDTWLAEKPSHRDAFAQAQQTWQLSKLFLVAGRPGTGGAEVQAFFDALEEIRCQRVGDFADS